MFLYLLLHWMFLAHFSNAQYYEFYDMMDIPILNGPPFQQFRANALGYSNLQYLQYEMDKRLDLFPTYWNDTKTTVRKDTQFIFTINSRSPKVFQDNADILQMKMQEFGTNVTILMMDNLILKEETIDEQLVNVYWWRGIMKTDQGYFQIECECTKHRMMNRYSFISIPDATLHTYFYYKLSENGMVILPPYVLEGRPFDQIIKNYVLEKFQEIDPITDSPLVKFGQLGFQPLIIGTLFQLAKEKTDMVKNEEWRQRMEELKQFKDTYPNPYELGPDHGKFNPLIYGDDKTTYKNYYNYINNNYSSSKDDLENEKYKEWEKRHLELEDDNNATTDKIYNNMYDEEQYNDDYKNNAYDNNLNYNYPQYDQFGNKVNNNYNTSMSIEDFFKNYYNN